MLQAFRAGVLNLMYRARGSWVRSKDKDGRMSLMLYGKKKERILSMSLWKIYYFTGLE